MPLDLLPHVMKYSANAQKIINLCGWEGDKRNPPIAKNLKPGRLNSIRLQNYHEHIWYVQTVDAQKDEVHLSKHSCIADRYG